MSEQQGMTSKCVYKTKQREELLEYLKTVPGQHITVGDACEHFKSCGKTIGTTTIYRHLEKMVAEGIVKKYIIDSNSPACFAYAGEEETSKDSCFHCKCEQCGKLIHVSCEDLTWLGEHLLQHHQFTLDKRRTVFYGICGSCMTLQSDKDKVGGDS